MKSFFQKLLHGIDSLTNSAIYQLIVSISLVIVSIYDSVKVILRDVSNLDMKKEHFIILVGLLMLINAINNLFKGVKKLHSSVETIEEQKAREEREAHTKEGPSRPHNATHSAHSSSDAK